MPISCAKPLTASPENKKAAMNPRVPEAIQPLLEEYLLLLDSKLPNFLEACYLQGSLALGAFNERLSDIDFIAFISRACTANDLESLKGIHQSLKVKFPRWPLEGSYLQWRDLGQPDSAISPHPHYHDGLLDPLAHPNLNDITWLTLKKGGIALKGPEVATLALEVDWPGLLANLKHNLNTYWASYTSNPGRIVWLFSDYGVQWAVLGVLRQYYTLKERDITSKTGAGQYGLTTLPPKWHRLIQEAINLREKAPTTSYKTKIGRALAAYQFLRYLIRTCNRLT
jgi:hypothetical protein